MYNSADAFGSMEMEFILGNKQYSRGVISNFGTTKNYVGIRVKITADYQTAEIQFYGKTDFANTYKVTIVPKYGHNSFLSCEVLESNPTYDDWTYIDTSIPEVAHTTKINKLTLLNGWINTDNTCCNSITKVGNTVNLRLRIANNSVPTNNLVCYIPNEYRPISPNNVIREFKARGTNIYVVSTLTSNGEFIITGYSSTVVGGQVIIDMSWTI